MASEASRTFAAPSSGDWRAASTTQCARWSSTRPMRHGLQGLGHGGDLGEDVDAVDVLVDHPGDAADLALDAAQALEVVVLGVGVAVHGLHALRGVKVARRLQHSIPLGGIPRP